MNHSSNLTRRSFLFVPGVAAVAPGLSPQDTCIGETTPADFIRYAAPRNYPAVFPPPEVIKAPGFRTYPGAYPGEDHERLIEETRARIQAA